MNREVEWTPNVIDRLKELHAHGDSPSYRFIAERLTKEFGFKFTRSGVSGKIYRLKMPPRQVPTPSLVDIAIRPVLASPPVRQGADTTRAMSAPRLPKKKGHEIDLLELRSGDCKWPSGTAVPYAFCGKPSIEDGAPYCMRHTKMAFVKPNKSWL
jgi:hypothetical protein